MVTSTETEFVLKVADFHAERELVVDLTAETEFQIGRGPGNSIPVIWDREVSREHAILKRVNEQIHVTCLPKATNPIVLNGAPVREVVVEDGDQFTIGKTTFCLEAGGQRNDDAVVDEIRLDENDLSGTEFGDPGRQMDLLCSLPEVISTAGSDIELATLLAEMLLNAIPQAVAVAAAQYSSDVVDALRGGAPVEECDLTRPQTMRVCTRDDYEGRFLPSRQLVGSAIRQSQPTIHIWGERDEESGGFTMSDSLDWAFCVPVPGDGAERWCLYVSGQGNRKGGLLMEKEDLLGDVRFARVLAQFIGSVRDVRQLQDQRTQLSSFFSPKVIENLTGADSAGILAPAEREISVLFCDVRGFSRKSEQHADDLHYLLSCVKEALGTMTQGILAQDGTIADFQGDAALGFWGWPVSLADGAASACRAALSILTDFRKGALENERLEGFSVGIGIAHGEAIAGQIGTTQQAKIGVFGPVVNQGSRLEGMTKQFGVSICLDKASADFARQWIRPEQARVRRLAQVRPKGMDTALEVSELLLPFGPECEITDEQIADYEKAVDLVTEGDWTAATSILEKMPDDGPSAFLLNQMARFDNAAPFDWDGAFSLTEK